MTYRHAAYMTEEELAAYFDVAHAPPEERRQAEAALAFLVDITIKNPIRAEDRDSYLIQCGMRAREFHLDAAGWRKAQEVLKSAQVEKNRLAAQDRRCEERLFAKGIRCGLDGIELARRVRRVLVRLKRVTDEPRSIPKIKILQNRISKFKSHLR